MSSRAGVLVHPLNGHRIEIYRGFSWPCLCFGCFWYGVKGMWGSALLAFFGAMMTLGLVWLVLPFLANEHYATFLKKQGYMTLAQYEQSHPPPNEGGWHNSTPNPSVADELAKIAALRDSGAVNEEEFQELKRRTLA